MPKSVKTTIVAGIAAASLALSGGSAVLADELVQWPSGGAPGQVAPGEVYPGAAPGMVDPTEIPGGHAPGHVVTIP